MRHLMKLVAALVVLTMGAEETPAQQAEGWVGQKVITRFGTVLKVGRQVVDDPYRPANAQAAQRDLLRVYRVDRTSGPWLWLVPEKEGISGWAKAAQVVPYDQAIDYLSREMRHHPNIAGLDPSHSPTDGKPDTGSKSKADGAVRPARTGNEETVERDLNDAQEYNNRGSGWAAKGDYAKAIADFNAATRLDPKSVAAYRNRAQAWQEQGEFDKAIADYKKVIQLDPQDARAYSERGTVWGAKGDSNQAIADFNVAIRLDPEDAAAYNNRGAAWQAKGDFDKAIVDFTEAIRLDPAASDAYNNRGLAWRLKGEPDKAIADDNEAIRLDPQVRQRVQQPRRRLASEGRRRQGAWRITRRRSGSIPNSPRRTRTGVTPGS